MKPPEPKVEFICRAEVQVAAPQTMGRTSAGERRVVQILHGRFEGRITGTVLPGGADYQIVTPDGVSYLDARYIVRTEDGALILIRNFGIRHGVIGDDPTQYYFRSTPRFETGSPEYEWLNRTIFVCSGARSPESVHVDFYAIR